MKHDQQSLIEIARAISSIYTNGEINEVHLKHSLDGIARIAELHSDAPQNNEDLDAAVAEILFSIVNVKEPSEKQLDIFAAAIQALPLTPLSIQPYFKQALTHLGRLDDSSGLRTKTALAFADNGGFYSIQQDDYVDTYSILCGDDYADPCLMAIDVVEFANRFLDEDSRNIFVSRLLVDSKGAISYKSSRDFSYALDEEESVIIGWCEGDHEDYDRLAEGLDDVFIAIKNSITAGLLDDPIKNASQDSFLKNGIPAILIDLGLEKQFELIIDHKFPLDIYSVFGPNNRFDKLKTKEKIGYLVDPSLVDQYISLESFVESCIKNEVLIPSGSRLNQTSLQKLVFGAITFDEELEPSLPYPGRIKDNLREIFDIVCNQLSRNPKKMSVVRRGITERLLRSNCHRLLSLVSSELLTPQQVSRHKVTNDFDI